MQAIASKIGIIGAGYSGVAMLAHLLKRSPKHEIYLFERDFNFGIGDAYRTKYPHHILNVRASNMSAFEDTPSDFVDWLKDQKKWHHLLKQNEAIDDQFVPRMLYRNYLQDILKNIQNQFSNVYLIRENITDLKEINGSSFQITSAANNSYFLDKVVLTIGNQLPSNFPFPVDQSVSLIRNPWDFDAPCAIESNQDVLIVGTGLSMIDAVLTLQKQNHQGKIYALSRHGYLPLPYTVNKNKYSIEKEEMPAEIREFFKLFRRYAKNFDWRELMEGVRPHIPSWWSNASLKEKKRFLRHLLPIWNIHRHRVPDEIAHLLKTLVNTGKLAIIAGHISKIENKIVKFKPRFMDVEKSFSVDWVINCMGPKMLFTDSYPPLIKSLIGNKLAMIDDLNLGLKVANNGRLLQPDQETRDLFALGSLCKGIYWATNSVPEIRHFCKGLAEEILTKEKVS